MNMDMIKRKVALYRQAQANKALVAKGVITPSECELLNSKLDAELAAINSQTELAGVQPATEARQARK